MKYGIKGHCFYKDTKEKGFYVEAFSSLISHHICDCENEYDEDGPEPDPDPDKYTIVFLKPFIMKSAREIIEGQKTVEEVNQILSSFQNKRFKFEVWE